MSRAGVGGARPGRPSTSAGPGPESALPSALACLSLLCRERNIRFNRRGLRKALADEPTLDLDAVVRYARRGGLSIDTGTASAEALRHPRSPVLMRRREGRFVLVAAMDDNNAWLLEPRTGGARPVPGAAFMDACRDEAAFLAEPTDSADETFTLRSVAGHLLRHKAEFGPLVATSFFISLLGFVYPLVFLIVIDKVVSSRGTATLDVLIGGLLFFLAFEAVLRGARHKVLRHVVRNVDRSLLSRLIRHALDLPASFHLRNSAVETLSRIEELRHLRRFLTNAVVFVCGCSCGSEETNSGDSSTPEEVAEFHGIEVKQGENAADISNISDEVVSTFAQVVDAFDTHAPGADVVITSGTDGEHREGSAHYSGNAIDLRANHISDDQAQAIAKDLNQDLGDNFDVIFEREDTDQVGEDEWSDHIHVEYDPK